MSNSKDILNADGGNFTTNRSTWGIADSPGITITKPFNRDAAQIVITNVNALTINQIGSWYYTTLLLPPNIFEVDANSSLSKINLITAQVAIASPNGIIPGLTFSLDATVTNVNGQPSIFTSPLFNDGNTTQRLDNPDNRFKSIFEVFNNNSNDSLSTPVYDSYNLLTRNGLVGFTLANNSVNSISAFKSLITQIGYIEFQSIQQTGIANTLNVQGTVTDEVNSDGSGSIILNVSGGFPDGEPELYSYEWNDGVTTKDRSNLSAGVYTVDVLAVGIGARVIKSFTVQNTIIPPPEVTASITNVSFSGGSDGQIILTEPQGSNYTYLWSNGETTKNILNLNAGIYSVIVTDQNTGISNTFEYEVIEPGQGFNVDPFFDIPKIQSIQFSQNKVELDNNRLDLTSHRQQKDFLSSFGYGFCYEQKFQQNDIVKVQIRSNSSSNIFNIIDEEGNTALSIIPQLERELAFQTNTYDIRIQNGGANLCRCYFQNFTNIPINLSAEDSIVLDIDGNDESFFVLGTAFDNIVGQEYFLIRKDFSTITQPNTTGDFRTATVDFDIYEAEINFSLLGEGKYYIESFSSALQDKKYYSEPIYVKQVHRDTNLFEFTNNDNAFNIDYTTGITHRIRLESIIFERNPTTEKTNLRNTKGNLTTLNAKARRNINIRFILLPPYIYEILAMAISMDSFKINNVEFISEDGLSEPDYIDRYGLASLEFSMEQKTWFEDFNGDDNNSIEREQGFIIANGGFIKR